MLTGCFSLSFRQAAKSGKNCCNKGWPAPTNPIAAPGERGGDSEPVPPLSTFPATWQARILDRLRRSKHGAL
jgi:hypothetical protein